MFDIAFSDCPCCGARSEVLAAKDDPSAWLGQRQTYGDLADQPVFADAFAAWLGLLWSDGPEAAIDRYLEG